MEEFLYQIARDLPSTGVLLLLLYLVNQQFGQGMAMLTKQMEDTNELLRRCIDGRNQRRNQDESD